MSNESVPESNRTVRRSQPSADVVRWVAEHHEAVYRYAFRLTGSVPDAEDLTQQTFLIAQQKNAQVRNTDRVRGWLFTVLRSCFLKLRRKKTPIPAGTLEYDLEAAARLPRDSEIDGERLQAALNELGDEFRVVLAMFYFEERSYKEIAEHLTVPIGTVMSRLSRAKAHLRKSLLAMEQNRERLDEVNGLPGESPDGVLEPGNMGRREC
jgi:RNA polymerase sigma-70 factor (ECF subfamily)